MKSTTKYTIINRKNIDITDVFIDYNDVKIYYTKIYEW
jgi:hypothetical protein